MSRSHEQAVTPQSENFSSWYNEIVLRAGLVDRGPAKGTMVIRPYGYRLWELLQAELDARIKATGHDNAYFPLLIPESYLSREAEHIEGFAPELAVVTHAGGKELDERLVVRPTSETIIGEMMAKWISSHRDLPLLLNQWANVVRWELRPRMFLRTTEFLWQEGHTAHADEEDAMRETMLALDFYTEVARDIAAIPVVPGEKTERERFAGAVSTYSIEGMMRDGRALQAGTSHYMGTNFARAFDIEYTGPDGKRSFCHTTSWGMSTRMIGAVVMAHGDDKGLVLPPRLAPYQVVVVPIARGEAASGVEAAVQQLRDGLIDRGVRVHVDDRPQLSPGFKFHEWELKGVPLRVEIGPRDVEAGVVTVSDRLSEGKEQIPLSAAVARVPGMLDDFHDRLLRRATDFRDSHTADVASRDEFTEVVSTGWAQAFHCGLADCEDDIKASTTATPRNVPVDAALEAGPCAWCGRPANYDRRVVFGRAYRWLGRARTKATPHAGPGLTPDGPLVRPTTGARS